MYDIISCFLSAQIQTTQQEATAAVQTLAEVASNHGEHSVTVPVTMEMSTDGTTQVATLTEATINSEGQIILAGDTSALGSNDGATKFGKVTLPR